MKFDELAILLNCHTFQDFPTHATGQDADSLLAHWTALWHPQFIADAGKMPTWYRADSPPTHDRARLLSVPRNQLLSSPDVVTREVMAAGGCVISDTTSREEFFAQLQGMPDGPALATALPPLPDTESPAADQLDLVEDFFALGYAYLQVELLTRQMRHSTRVQETAFEEQLVAAARAALRGERDTCRESLQTCYDFLSQERDHYYAVDVYLIDVSLLAVPYCGAGLRKQLRETSKSNLLLTADLLLHLEQKEPESLALLRQTLDEHRVGLIGGEYSSWPLQLLSTETARSQLTQGRAEFQRVLGLSPRVFGRHRFGLNPSLPALLHHFGFTGVLHATLDGGRFPEGSQSKSRWEGDGQRSLDAILRAPLDASQSGIFLALATSIGESMDMDHIATRCFAHWSGEISPWYRDLQRATRFTRALGRFVTLDEYFKDTYDPGLHDRFSADEYRSPFLQQPLPEVKERPISSIVQYWHQQILLQQWSQLTTLCLLVKDTEAARSAHERAQSTIDEWNRTPLDASWESRFAEVPALLERSANDLATALSATTQPSSIPGPNASDGARLLINPLSFPRRVGPVLLDHPPTVQAPVYAIDEHQGTVSVIADVPSMGLARLCAGPPAKRRGKLPPPIADGEWLRNDFLEAHIDRQTGALRAVKDYGSRTNRLSQQLAYRWLPASNGPGGYYPKPEPHYSQMIGESLHIEHADTVVGRIATTGRLIDDKQTTLARFKQTYQLVRGSRTLEIEVEIQPEIQPDGEPWDNYYGCRFAWSNEASDLARSLADGRRATTARQFESPLFVEIEDGQHRTVVITGGLAFHRTVGRRMLDSLLIVRNEPQRKFRVGIAIDPKQPFREALAFFAPTIQLANSHHPIATNSAWLFHIDARHVMISNCLPLWKDDRVAGVKIRLVEIEGRSGPVLIRSFRSFANARKVDAAGQTAEQCDVDSEGIRLNIAAHELVELEASFV